MLFQIILVNDCCVVRIFFISIKLITEEEDLDVRGFPVKSEFHFHIQQYLPYDCTQYLK